MPDQTYLSELTATLEWWSSNLPARLRETIDFEPTGQFGERHGSWFLNIHWWREGLWRLAEISLTNTEAVPDSQSTSAVVASRSAAYSDERFVIHVNYQRRRSTSRLNDADLLSMLSNAAEVANGFSELSLRDSYMLGVPR